MNFNTTSALAHLAQNGEFPRAYYYGQLLPAPPSMPSTPAPLSEAPFSQEETERIQQLFQQVQVAQIGYAPSIDQEPSPINLQDPATVIELLFQSVNLNNQRDIEIAGLKQNLEAAQQLSMHLIAENNDLKHEILTLQDHMGSDQEQIADLEHDLNLEIKRHQSLQTDYEMLDGDKKYIETSAQASHEKMEAISKQLSAAEAQIHRLNTRINKLKGTP